MFSENLKAYRKAKGLTQEELAVRLHVVRQTVSKWEKGLSVPDADLLVRLAEVLEVSVSQPTRSPNSWPGSTSSWPSKTAGPNGSGSAWPGC